MVTPISIKRYEESCYRKPAQFKLETTSQKLASLKKSMVQYLVRYFFLNFAYNENLNIKIWIL